MTERKNGIELLVDLSPETVILGLLVMVAIVISISAVVSEFVLVLAGYIGVLEIAVVLLLVGRSRIFAIRNNSGHNGAQNQNLKFVIWVFRIKNNQPGGIQLKFKKSKNSEPNVKLTARKVFMLESQVRLRRFSSTIRLFIGLMLLSYTVNLKLIPTQLCSHESDKVFFLFCFVKAKVANQLFKLQLIYFKRFDVETNNR
jgi:hypothetical protein